MITKIAYWLYKVAQTCGHCGGGGGHCGSLHKK
jgi:hypothetical protein